MDIDHIKKLGRTWKRTKDAYDEARHALGLALLEATEADVPQKDLAAAVDTNREQIRLMVNRARADRAKG
jgi:hypothetical protein